MINADLHLHSCLSPCADDDASPFDLIGMAKLNGLDLIALTDHNSAKNCPAAALAANEYDIGFIPGTEINTAEEVHCVCLFPTVTLAMAFDEALDPLRPGLKNKPDIFGYQRIVHADGTIEEEPDLLIPALGISILDLPVMVKEYSGLIWPAHVDRDAFGLFAMLGVWPKNFKADAAEIRFCDPGGIPIDLKRITASDAHRLKDMPEGGFPLPLETPDFHGLEKYLRSGRVGE